MFHLDVRMYQYTEGIGHICTKLTKPKTLTAFRQSKETRITEVARHRACYLRHAHVVYSLVSD